MPTEEDLKPKMDDDPDGTPVETATGFGTLNSSQIAFSSGPQNYIAQAHAAMAGLMLAA